MMDTVGLNWATDTNWQVNMMDTVGLNWATDTNWQVKMMDTVGSTSFCQVTQMNLLCQERVTLTMTFPIF